MIVDYTAGGKCTRCGSCCTNYLPTTDKEFRRLRLWVKKHDYVPAIALSAPLAEDLLDTTCPFYDKAAKVCVCYDIRPSVCRAFSCHNYKPGGVNLPYKKRKYAVRNLRKEIFNQDVLPYRDWLVLSERIRRITQEEKSNE